MRFGRLLPALSVLLAAGALIVLTGTGAAAPQPGLAAPAASTPNVAVPAALGRASLVIQRGARNYAGPNCPGKGWNCTTSTRVLQIATAHGQNKVQCTTGAAVTLTPQSCVIVQTGTNNSAKCLQRTNSSAADQHCSITQSGRKNSAHVDQFVHAAGSDTQSAKQTAEIEQTSTHAGGNTSNVYQAVRQSTHPDPGGSSDAEHETGGPFGFGSTILGACGAGGGDDDDGFCGDDVDGPPGPPAAAQIQDVEQVALVTQTAAGSGENFSRVHQSERLKAWNALIQSQNTAGGSFDCAPGEFPFAPNACANINQSSAAGNNKSHLKQSIRETARTPVDASQQQGSFSGGIEGVVHQTTSSGRSTSDAKQSKRQRLTAPPGSSQVQFDPLRCCGVDSQIGGTGNVSQVDQTSTQAATESSAYQQISLLGEGRSPTGRCTVSQDASNNSGSTPNGATADPCVFLQVITHCESGGEFEDPGCTAVEPITTPPCEESCPDFTGPLFALRKR